jgi:geranylgeranyl diphosphate synthase type II
MTKLYSIEEYLQEKAPLINRQLEELLPEDNVSYGNLYKAARYSLLAPGKRLRPVLTLATVETLGGDLNAALTPACTLEMVHTYSLIHDDLPCMDDDDLRRGRPTLHKVYPESHAVLTGDFLLTYAFETLVNSPGLNSDQKLRLVRTLALRSGGQGMIGGQVMDLEAEGITIDLATMQETHLRKTAALLTASLEFGGIISNCSTDILESLKLFGRDIGLAFQVIDDVLDVTSDEKTLGKTAQSDLHNEKSTYVSLLGEEETRRCAQDLYHSSLKHLESIPHDTGLLAALAKRIITRIS